jgi:hypothetical protein
MDVSVALSTAKVAGAERHAPYEYTAAEEYLQKAREEYGYSDYLAAERYAVLALDMATRAKRRAEARTRGELAR